MDPQKYARSYGEAIKYGAGDAHKGFHSLLQSEPEEHTHTLVYADYLQDSDKPHHAELLRRSAEWNKHFDEPPLNVDDFSTDYVKPGESWAGSFPLTKTVESPDSHFVHLSVRSLHNPAKSLKWAAVVRGDDERLRLMKGLKAEGAKLPRGHDSEI